MLAYLKTALLLVLLLVGWNYWLPMAENFYNYLAKSNGDQLRNVDFFIYYNTGKRIDDGQNPYYWGQQDESQPDFSDFLYPPTFLPLYRLLAQLNYDRARFLWLVLYGLSFAFALGWMFLSFAKEDRTTFLALSLLLIITS